MSRYTILIVLNLPLVIAAIVNALVSYKMGRSSRRRFVFRMVFWLMILSGLVFAEPIYNYLASNNLTQSEPLSLFDVIEVTGIILALFVANQAYSRVDRLEQRVHSLQQEVSIRLADRQSSKTKK